MKNSSTDSSEPTPNAAQPELETAEVLRGQATRYLVVLATGLLVGLVVAELLLRTFVLAVDDGRAHRIQVIYRASSPDVVLGDSHLYLPFVNSDRFVGLARAGSSPMALEIVAREYFRHVAPGRVIVEASPQLFRRAMEERRDQGHAGYFTHHFGQPFVVAVLEPGIRRELAAIWNFPALIKSADMARGRKKIDGPVVDGEAKRRRELTMGEHLEETRARLQSNQPMPDVTTRESFRAYRRTLEALQERGAQLCMASTPVTTLYLALSGENPAYVEAERALRALATELDVPFVDFVDLDLPLEVDSFRNPDHLTTRSGELYAARLERACFSPRPAAGP